MAPLVYKRGSTQSGKNVHIAALDNGTKMFDTEIKAGDPLMDGVV